MFFTDLTIWTNGERIQMNKCHAFHKLVYKIKFSDCQKIFASFFLRMYGILELKGYSKVEKVSIF